MDEVIESKLKNIISIVLNLEKGENPETARKLSNERWDSLAQINMIAAIESEFQVSIDPKYFTRFTSYKSIKIILNEILGGNGVE
jgi:acyl carrier protein